jgi:extracellular factor (EF) 3-hydroxypalmitic acid methyl ester biosynthesis protein
VESDSATGRDNDVDPMVPISGLAQVDATSADTASTSEVVNYAELRGTRGRDVFFRPDRYQRSELGPVGVAVEFASGGENRRSELFDVSQSGLAFAWPSALPVELGTVLDEIVVRFDEHEAYRGAARVSSVRRDGERTIVGVSLFDALMNIEDVLHLRDVKAWAGGVNLRGLGLRDAPWRVSGQERFKSLVAELRLTLEDAQAKFGALEASLPWHVAHGDPASDGRGNQRESPARDALIERVRSEFVVDGVQLSNEIDAAYRFATRAERSSLREYSSRFVHDLLMQSPWMHRARHKPLGYPGDYEIMNGLYGNHFSGATLFAKAVNLCFVSTPAAAAVRARKDRIKHELLRLIEEHRGPDPVRILSIAAGPAQEVYELLAERDELPCRVEIVLFDQDKRALSFSYGRLQRLIARRFRDSVSVVHLNDSIKHLLRGPEVFEGHEAFHAVYSCGLFDYLQLLTSVSLCRSLYSLVAPGGRLFVGNMVPSSPSRWFMELHLDWFLVYREREEMLEFARMAAPDARAEIMEEATGVNPFVVLRRE